MKILKYLTIGIITVFFTFVISFLWSMPSKQSISPTLCTELKQYCKKHNLCDTYCIVVDYSIYSGKDRMFLVDLQNNYVECSYLCAHGIGKNFDCIVTPKFSNTVGSNYSSLGHYKLGAYRKTSKYNLNSIELHGLDTTNSNAYERGILLHDGLPDFSVIGLPCLPLSQGCFTVSHGTLATILNLKNDCEKPLLLYCTNKSVFQ